MTECVKCRDCKFWMVSPTDREKLKEHPVTIKPKDDWISGVCDKLLSTLEIETSSDMWHSATVDSISTTANFGCVVGEVNEN